jgi:hypothetical protein
MTDNLRTLSESVRHQLNEARDVSNVLAANDLYSDQTALDSFISAAERLAAAVIDSRPISPVEAKVMADLLDLEALAREMYPAEYAAITDDHPMPADLVDAVIAERDRRAAARDNTTLGDDRD